MLNVRLKFACDKLRGSLVMTASNHTWLPKGVSVDAAAAVPVELAASHTHTCKCLQKRQQPYLTCGSTRTSRLTALPHTSSALVGPHQGFCTARFSAPPTVTFCLSGSKFSCGGADQGEARQKDALRPIRIGSLQLPFTQPFSMNSPMHGSESWHCKAALASPAGMLQRC